MHRNQDRRFGKNCKRKELKEMNLIHPLGYLESASDGILSSCEINLLYLVKNFIWFEAHIIHIAKAMRKTRAHGQWLDTP